MYPAQTLEVASVLHWTLANFKNPETALCCALFKEILPCNLNQSWPCRQQNRSWPHYTIAAEDRRLHFQLFRSISTKILYIQFGITEGCSCLFFICNMFLQIYAYPNPSYRKFWEYPVTILGKNYTLYTRHLTIVKIRIIRLPPHPPQTWSIFSTQN